MNRPPVQQFAGSSAVCGRDWTGVAEGLCGTSRPIRAFVAGTGTHGYRHQYRGPGTYGAIAGGKSAVVGRCARNVFPDEICQAFDEQRVTIQSRYDMVVRDTRLFGHRAHVNVQ
jgi:hypothetical protein